MATNFFFNNFQASQEQMLLENLIIEAIKIYGQDMYYLPRNLGKYDQLYTADDQSYYKFAIPIEMYIKSVDGFQGDGNFMSKFGLEIRDQVIFSVAQRVFFDEVGAPNVLERPREGDLVWFPLNKKLFQIKYVNKFEMFYQLGALQTWELTCELYEYGSEDIDVGIPEIDHIQQRFSTNMLDYALLTEDGYYLTDEDGNYIITELYNLEQETNFAEENDEIQRESDLFIDFSVQDPFSEGNI